MFGFDKPWKNMLALICLIIATAILYTVLDKAKLTLTLGVTILITVSGFAIAFLNREKDAVKKSIEEKVPRKEFESTIESVLKRIDDHRDDDKEKYESLSKLISETNKTTKEILFAMNKKR